MSVGKIRYIGVSNFKAWQVMKAQGVAERRGFLPLVAAQYQDSLVLRDIEHDSRTFWKAKASNWCRGARLEPVS